MGKATAVLKLQVGMHEGIVYFTSRQALDIQGWGYLPWWITMSLQPASLKIPSPYYRPDLMGMHTHLILNLCIWLASGQCIVTSENVQSIWKNQSWSHAGKFKGYIVNIVAATFILTATTGLDSGETTYFSALNTYYKGRIWSCSNIIYPIKESKSKGLISTVAKVRISWYMID